MKRNLLFAAAVLLTVSAAPALADVNVNIGISPPVVVQPVPPPVVVQPVPPPPGSIVVVPTLPAGVVIAPGPAAYWFWDDRVNLWFYFDVKRHRHYARDHVYIDDGRHYYIRNNHWVVGHEDVGRHRGWYKHEEKREYKREKRERKHEEKERRWEEKHGNHGHG